MAPSFKVVRTDVVHSMAVESQGVQRPLSCGGRLNTGGVFTLPFYGVSTGFLRVFLRGVETGR